MVAVVGDNTDGVGVSGTGSTYGVQGTSTGNFAGIVGSNGGNSTAPGIYAQTLSRAPGLFAINGLAQTADAFSGASLDSAAASYTAKYPDNAGIFVGSVTVTDNLHVVGGASPGAAAGQDRR